MYSKKELLKLFLQVKNSYPECKKTKLHFFETNFTGYSSPFTGNIKINIKKINKHKFSKDAVIGVIAHEFGHQISYQKRSFIQKYLFIWNYYLSTKKRKIVEDEADNIAIKRGYGKQLLEESKIHFKLYEKDEKLLNYMKKVYASPQKLKERIGKSN